MHRLASTALVFGCLALVSRDAAAHITLMDPAPRTEQQKSGPCGAGPGDMRGDKITTYQAGETITLRWIETVNHPGHYRISFDADGQDDFADPAAFDDYDSNPAVLLDAIPDKDGQNTMYEAQVTLPNINCDNCTLQLVQMMTDKAPYGDGNDLYYQCADIIVEGAVAESTGGEQTTGGDPSTGGEQTTGGSGGEATTHGHDSTGHASEGGNTGTAGGEDPTSGGVDQTTGDHGTAGTGDHESHGDSSTGDVGGDDDKGGCGCRSDASGAAGLWGLLLLPALGRRRRRA